MRKRMLAWLLIAIFLLSAVSCGTLTDGGSATDGNSNSVTEAEKEYRPEIEQKNYDCEFNIATVHDPDLVLMDATTGDSLSDSVYERTVKIKDHVGVELVLLDAGDWIELPNTIKRTVMSGDDTYQLGMTHVYQGLSDLITSNCLYDFGSLESVNLQAPYWSTELMEEVRIGDKYLLGHSDFFLTDVHCILFNKEMMTKYNMDAPYQLVRDKEWTIERFMEMAAVVSVDNGDGKWDNQDTYGLTGWGWVYLIDFVTSSDLKIVEKDADTGNYVIAYQNNNDKMTELVETMFELYNADYTYLWKSHDNGNPDLNVNFADGTSLFTFYNISALSNLREEEIRFGVLPYPLYDTNQENYKTLNWSGMMVVPSVIRNPEMVGDVLELLGYYTAPVKTAYYEEQLGSKLADAPEDAEMMDLIWDTLVSDIGLITCNCDKSMDSLVYMIPQLCESGRNTYASFSKTHTRNAQRALNRLFGQE